MQFKTNGVTMITDEQKQTAVDLLERSERILITTHVKPDGDACGSVSGLAQALRERGKHIRTLFLSEIPHWYAFLLSEPPVVLGEDISKEQLMSGRWESFDLVVLVDVNSVSQLPVLTDYLDKTGIPVLVIDHHATADHLGTVELVDTSAAAAGILVYELIKYAQWPIKERMAEALFVAAATDSRVYRDCAELIELGANPSQIHDKLYKNYSVARFRLMQTMLDRLELHFHDRFALQCIRHDDFIQTGANYEDTENFINECHRIGTVKASTLLIELEDGRIRCSLRSRGDVDVSRIAAFYGGGGHKMAAGAFLPGPLEHAKNLILDHFQPLLG